MHRIYNIFVLFLIVFLSGVAAYVVTPAPQSTEIQPVETKAIYRVSTESTQKTAVQPATTPLYSNTKHVTSANETITDTTVYTIPILSNTTVLEAMETHASSDSYFSFTGRDFPGLGFFLEEINEKENDNGFYWTLFIDNELSERGSSFAEVASGDNVEWRYQKGI